MFYVYALISLKNKRLYIGYTNDLRRRVKEHNTNGSIYTSKNKPYKLIYYEAFIEKLDATKQEKFYKSGYGREVLNGKIENSLRNLRA
ncbi:hypothetical protein A2363_01370 [Candidatus Gottesmanbacteria bacterium RIFOXYB1_FULL_47_11]|uniref:GIY-YIG domain-containing protein n=1 Tax=Candidatus Gottesmanbacteria bacterium RIFOXYB1_FULL_47_11 TaxID=1798401 RepID=A0A1F6BDU4_9BACT|nr:MAG: hypothetical protein A2363_01370 [Candidatus Gottesmanbacteria bacterium RIFOXYB1_FULL_47_11]